MYKIGDKIKLGDYPDIVNGAIKTMPIDWTIVEVNDNATAIAITDKVLDCVHFDNTNDDYNDSFLKKYVEYKFGNVAFIPSAEQIEKWFQNVLKRRAKTTKYAQSKGVVSFINNCGIYWTSTKSSLYLDVCVVDMTGQFTNTHTYTSSVGIRPAIILKELNL